MKCAQKSESSRNVTEIENYDFTYCSSETEMLTFTGFLPTLIIQYLMYAKVWA